MFSILKTKIITLVSDLDICRSWVNISVIIVIVSNSSGKHMGLIRSWFLLRKEYGVVGVDFSIVFYFCCDWCFWSPSRLLQVIKGIGLQFSWVQSFFSWIIISNVKTSVSFQGWKAWLCFPFLIAYAGPMSLQDMS